MMLASAPAWAQRIEVAALAGYNTSAALDRTADGVDELKIDDGWSWGARGTYWLTERFGVEGLWTYQATSLDMTAGGSTAEVFEMTINQLLAHAVYQFGAADHAIRPFVFGGMGATFFASDDLDGQTNFAWDLGAGVQWFVHRRIGVEGRLRYRPTELGDTSSETCGPFGFCQGTLKNIDIAAGVVVRF